MTESISDIVDLQPGERVGVEPQRARAMAGDEALIVCDNLVKIYKVADLEVVALQGLDLLVERGEFIALVGASGSGKSTLLNILGGLDVPSAGRATVAGHHLGEMDPKERTAYRRRVIGFVWQQSAKNLLPYLTAVENVELPMLLEGVAPADRQARATELLELVGSESAATIAPTASPAASSSASRSQWPSPTGRPSCSPTSRPASWTRTPRSRSSTCCDR